MYVSGIYLKPRAIDSLSNACNSLVCFSCFMRKRSARSWLNCCNSASICGLRRGPSGQFGGSTFPAQRGHTHLILEQTSPHADPVLELPTFPIPLLLRLLLVLVLVGSEHFQLVLQLLVGTLALDHLAFV